MFLFNTNLFNYTHCYCQSCCSGKLINILWPLGLSSVVLYYYLQKPTVYRVGTRQWVASVIQCGKNAWKHKNVRKYCRWHHRWWGTQFSQHQLAMSCSKVTAESEILLSLFNWKPNLNILLLAYGKCVDTVKTSLILT